MIINDLLEKEKMSRYRLSKESGVAMTTISSPSSLFFCLFYLNQKNLMEDLHFFPPFLKNFLAKYVEICYHDFNILFIILGFIWAGAGIGFRFCSAYGSPWK